MGFVQVMSKEWAPRYDKANTSEALFPDYHGKYTPGALVGRSLAGIRDIQQGFEGVCVLGQVDRCITETR